LFAFCCFAACAAALLWPKTKVLRGEWTIIVKNEHGIPLQNVTITQNWQDYGLDIHGGGEARTNKFGSVTFPPVIITKSLAFFVMRPLVTKLQFGIHASSGFAAKGWAITPNCDSSRSAGCDGASCGQTRIMSELRTSCGVPD